jgi:Zn-dependent protease/CBS domain-containing protein
MRERQVNDEILEDHRRPGQGHPLAARGLPIGSVAGVEVRLDWSLLIIFALIMVALGWGLFPYWHPDWGVGPAVLTAFGAAVLFLVSVLLHELSHALVGRRLGVEIRRITLFVFGGMAHMESEPANWRSELAMAIAGPVTSLVLGIVFLWVASLLTGPIQIDPQRPTEAMSRLGPLATLLLWLGPINILLGLFNLVPGFPLDGGRVLRAILWGITGDLTRATRWASGTGQLVAWALIGTGFAMILGIQVPLFGTGLVGGLWLALIGWFLNNAAIVSYRRQLVLKSLGDLHVRRIMTTDYQTATPDMSIRELVETRLLRTSQRAYPVVDGDGLRGMICLEDVRRLERDRWGEVRVADAMTAVAQLSTVTPESLVSGALDLLVQRGVNQLPVISRGRLVGMVTREDIFRWLALHGGARSDAQVGG